MAAKLRQFRRVLLRRYKSHRFDPAFQETGKRRALASSAMLLMAAAGVFALYRRRDRKNPDAGPATSDALPGIIRRGETFHTVVIERNGEADALSKRESHLIGVFEGAIVRLGATGPLRCFHGRPHQAFVFRGASGGDGGLNVGRRSQSDHGRSGRRFVAGGRWRLPRCSRAQ